MAFSGMLAMMCMSSCASVSYERDQSLWLRMTMVMLLGLSCVVILAQ